MKTTHRLEFLALCTLLILLLSAIKYKSINTEFKQNYINYKETNTKW